MAGIAPRLFLAHLTIGHSQTSTTLNIYAHAVQQANENALNSVAALLETA